MQVGSEYVGEKPPWLNFPFQKAVLGCLISVLGSDESFSVFYYVFGADAFQNEK